MTQKILFFLTGLLILANASFASATDKQNVRIILGFTGGVSQQNSLSGDIYGGIIMPVDKSKIELNCGYSFFKNNTNYSRIEDLEFSSHGLFMEGNYYIIDKLYGGLRFAVNFNWINKESQQKFNKYPDIDSPTFFSGLAGYAHLGYHQPITKKIGVKLQGQMGIHNYKIAEGSVLIDNSSSDIINLQFGIERHTELLYNVSISLTFKI